MGYKFLDFNKSINEQLEKSLVDVLHSGFWSTGPQSRLLEDTLSEIYQRPCVTTSSGGTALQSISVLYPQIKKIAVQSNTYFASCLPWISANKEIILLGSKKNLLMPDIRIVKNALEHEPDAIVLTHIGGYPNPDILEISNLCKQRGVMLIEDCAHAPLVKINGQYVGTFGDGTILYSDTSLSTLYAPTSETNFRINENRYSFKIGYSGNPAGVRPGIVYNYASCADVDVY